MLPGELGGAGCRCTRRFHLGWNETWCGRAGRAGRALEFLYYDADEVLWATRWHNPDGRRRVVSGVRDEGSGSMRFWRDVASWLSLQLLLDRSILVAS